MLILLPPSEGKSLPRRGRPLDLGSLSFPDLTPTRDLVLTSLGTLCSRSPVDAARVLGLGPTQADEILSNTALRTAPCAPAIRVYSGVLFDALDFPTLTAAAQRRARARIAISSGLWGLVRVTDRIPGYRLSGSVSLPGVGTLAGTWRKPVAAEIEASSGVVIDLRSSTYSALGPIPEAACSRAIVVRVIQERDGVRTIVSHMNKATKGRILRASLESDSTIRNASDLLDGLHDWGFAAEEVPRKSGPRQIDVIVAEL